MIQPVTVFTVETIYVQPHYLQGQSMVNYYVSDAEFKPEISECTGSTQTIKFLKYFTGISMVLMELREFFGMSLLTGLLTLYYFSFDIGDMTKTTF